jgi:hypothetical protein
MIDIRNQAGERLILSMDQALTTETSAGWLADDELPGAKSYPIKFPLEPNERFLQSSYRPESARPVMELTVNVRLEGVLYRRCVLEYRVNEGEGDGFLKIDAGEVWNKLRNLSLPDAVADLLNLGTTPMGLAARMKEIALMPANQFPCTFFPIRNEAFFEADLDATKVPGFVRQPYVNAWGLLLNIGWGFKIDSATVKGYPVVPQFYLCWVLEQVFARAGYRVEGDWFADPETQRLTILNMTAMAVQRIGIANVLSHFVVPGQHLPKISVGDFLKAIRQRYGLLFSFDGNKQVVTIRQFRKVASSPAVDLTPYLAGKYSIDAPKNTGFTLVDSVDAQDELYKDADGNDVRPVTVSVGGVSGTDREEVQLKLGTAQVVYEPGHDGGVYWNVPTVRQPGNTLDENYKNSERYPEARKPGQVATPSGSDLIKNDIAFRVLSYRGMQEAANRALYPLGTNDVRSGRQDVVGTQATALTGRYGLWSILLRSFYYFRDQTRAVTVPLDMPVSVVAGLKLHEPIALKLSGQTRRHYLVQKLMAESPGTSGLMECKLTVLSLPDGIDLPLNVDDEPVWVELVVSDVYTEGPVIPPGPWRGFQQNLATLTLRFWADRSKSQAVNVSNLAINIRTKKNLYPQGEYQPRAPYIETVDSYLVNGQSQVLSEQTYYTRLTRYQRRPGQEPLLLDDYVASYVLDPGEGYNIISPPAK